MFGVPIYGSTNIFCDNEAVCVNTTRPELTLSKKNHSIAYHCAQEEVATGMVRVSKEHTLTTGTVASNHGNLYVTLLALC